MHDKLITVVYSLAHGKFFWEAYYRHYEHTQLVAWQSFFTTSLQVHFSLPLGPGPFTSSYWHQENGVKWSRKPQVESGCSWCQWWLVPCSKLKTTGGRVSARCSAFSAAAKRARASTVCSTMTRRLSVASETTQSRLHFSLTLCGSVVKLPKVPHIWVTWPELNFLSVPRSLLHML